MLAIPGGSAEFRRKVQQEAQERTALRESELELQASPSKGAQERIGIWERLHAVFLPGAPTHALVKVIAKQTRLTVEQVREEQRRRAGTLATQRTQVIRQRSDMQETER
ncbi:MAG TPA: hypothetical protein VJS12_08970 [Steroidobacteraceae bacterium]|nr:hypothetical protein [Steroidobacteraceae bacterium]